MNNRFVVIVIACIAVFLGLVFFVKKDANAPSSQETVNPSNHVSGQGTTGVTVVEYGDFECPSCGLFFPLIKQVKAKYGDQITFQFRHFPIVSLHKNAMSAHRAAEAASVQGKFWEMHDLLYERQNAWTTSSNPASLFKGYAEELGLNMDQYSSDLIRAETASVIQQDLKAGQDLGVGGTPTFFIDGKKVENSQIGTLDDFSKQIDAAIAAKQQ